MKRSDLEQYLGKVVTIKLFDNDVITGNFTKQVKNGSGVTRICTYRRSAIS